VLLSIKVSLPACPSVDQGFATEITVPFIAPKLQNGKNAYLEVRISYLGRNKHDKSGIVGKNRWRVFWAGFVEN